MKKSKYFVVVAVVVALLLSFVPAGFAGKSCLPENDNNCDVKPVVALIVVNDARSTFDDEITQKITTRITAKLSGVYTVVPGEVSLKRLEKAGITDIATADKRELAKVLKCDNIDYAVYVEVEPLVRKERWTVFSHGMNITAVVPFKILDVKAAKYLYNGKFVELVADSTFVALGIGNKSVALTAIDRVLDKIEPLLVNRLP